MTSRDSTSPIPMRRKRNWDVNLLSLFAAKQDQIAEGDIVRAYDMPGQRDDCYLEGVVTEVEAGDRVKIHVTREVRRGKEEQMGARLIVWGPLGVSISYRAPCVFLIAKREERS